MKRREFLKAAFALGIVPSAGLSPSRGTAEVFSLAHIDRLREFILDRDYFEDRAEPFIPFIPQSAYESLLREITVRGTWNRAWQAYRICRRDGRAIPADDRPLAILRWHETRPMRHPIFGDVEVHIGRIEGLRFIES